MRGLVSLTLFLLLFPLWATQEQEFIAHVRETRFLKALGYIEGGKSVDAIVEDGERALILMCREQRTLQLRWLLDQGADPGRPDSQGYTPLMIAARLGNRDMIQILLQAGAPLNDYTPSGETALSLAINSGQRDVARYLESLGGVLRNRDFAHPLLEEVWTRRYHYAQALRVREKRWFYYDFLLTVLHGTYKEVWAMLSQGYRADAVDTEEVSALMLAAARRDPYVGELLLSTGADPFHEDNLGLSALWYASFNNNIALMKILLDVGVIDNMAWLEKSPLFGAFVGGAYEAMALLLDRDWSFNVRGARGARLIHYAAFYGDMRTIEELQKRGASLLVTDDEGRNAQDYLLEGLKINQNESLYLPIATYLKEKRVRPQMIRSSEVESDAIKRSVYSPW